MQWSLGFLRKNYTDQDTYVCHLYDSTCNKLCTICNECNPTIKGENVNQWYHYHCAVQNDIHISPSRYVDFIDFFNEQRKLIEMENSLEKRRNSEIEIQASSEPYNKASATPTSICELGNIPEAKPLSLERSQNIKKV